MKTKIKNRNKNRNTRKLFLEMNRSQKVIVRCFIAQLEGVEGHAVYLAIDRNGEIELTVVSLHSTVIKAWSVAVAARRILENSSYSYKHSNEVILKTFVAALVADYFDYSSDSVLNEIEVPSKWKTFSTKSKHPDFANGVFVIGTSATEILMLEEEPKKLILANTYLMSAYIADFMNENQLDSLVLPDIDRLVHEARRAFSSTKHRVNYSLTAHELLRWAYK
ncbi:MULTISPECIES: hypothetical protein [unclassified Microcoleus]|uniref:hypothetical protein n=1 Tax=unclassified Microcoleus TaxID=2642155 RepID=UPI002FD6E965